VIPTRSAPPTAVRALARVEARRVMRHPALLIGAAAATYLSLRGWIAGRPPEAAWPTQTYEQLTLLWSPLHLGAMLAATMVALRPRGDAAAEMLAVRPLGERHRTAALLLAGTVPMAVTAAVITVNWLLIADAGGIPTGFPEPVILFPTVADAAYAICLTGSAYAAGIALARAYASRLLSTVLGSVFAYVFFLHYWTTGWLPVYFVVPYVSPMSAVPPDGSPTDLPISQIGGGGGWLALVRDTDLVACRAVYIAGVGVLLTAFALRRSDRDSRIRPLVVLGSILATGGVLLQFPAYSGAWAMLGSWWSFLDAWR
jgi:hypothetical protein